MARPPSRTRPGRSRALPDAKGDHAVSAGLREGRALSRPPSRTRPGRSRALPRRERRPDCAHRSPGGPRFVAAAIAHTARTKPGPPRRVGSPCLARRSPGRALSRPPSRTRPGRSRALPRRERRPDCAHRSPGGPRFVAAAIAHTARTKPGPPRRVGSPCLARRSPGRALSRPPSRTRPGRSRVPKRERRPCCVRGRLVEPSLPIRDPEHSDLEGLRLRLEDDVAIVFGVEGHGGPCAVRRQTFH